MILLLTKVSGPTARKLVTFSSASFCKSSWNTGGVLLRRLPKSWTALGLMKSVSKVSMEPLTQFNRSTLGPGRSKDPSLCRRMTSTDRSWALSFFKARSHTLWHSDPFARPFGLFWRRRRLRGPRKRLSETAKLSSLWSSRENPRMVRGSVLSKTYTQVAKDHDDGDNDGRW